MNPEFSSQIFTKYSHTRGVVNKFPDWIFRARTERSYHTSR